MLFTSPPKYMVLDAKGFQKVQATELFEYIKQAVSHYKEALPTHHKPHFLDEDTCLATTLNTHKFILINGEYLLAYSVSNYWYSRKKVLNEEYLYRVAQGPTTLKDVRKVLSSLAKLHGCMEAQVGTLAVSNQQAASRLYKAAGFKPLLQVMRC